MKLKKFKKELLKISLLLGLVSLTSCVKPSPPKIINNFCEWATPLKMTQEDFNYIEDWGSDMLLDHLVIYNEEYNNQCNDK